jgi:uroporphyrinogen-III synthase
MPAGSSPCGTCPPLAGHRVGVTAHRRAEEQAELLRRRGAEVVLGPVVCTRPFGDDRPLRDATDTLLDRPPDLVVATTGIGVRSWFAAAESWGVDGDLRAVLAAARVTARGPKAAAALLGVGVPDPEQEPTERLDGLIDRLVAAGVGGRRVALQLYGEDVPWAVERLAAAGADVVAVPVYRWTAADELEPARQLLRDVLAGDVDAVTFTSAAAVRSFAALADESGSGDRLREQLSTAVVAACVGPVTGEAAAAAGFTRRCVPDRGRLGLMVRALSHELHRRHRHLRAGDDDVVLHGAAVWGPDGRAHLSGLDRALLAVLAERPGAVVGRATLRRRVWANRCEEKTVDAGVARLRRALQPSGLRVDIVPRRGWLLAAAASSCPTDAFGRQEPTTAAGV